MLVNQIAMFGRNQKFGTFSLSVRTSAFRLCIVKARTHMDIINVRNSTVKVKQPAPGTAGRSPDIQAPFFFGRPSWSTTESIHSFPTILRTRENPFQRPNPYMSFHRFVCCNTGSPQFALACRKRGWFGSLKFLNDSDLISLSCLFGTEVSATNQRHWSSADGVRPGNRKVIANQVNVMRRFLIDDDRVRDRALFLVPHTGRPSCFPFTVLMFFKKRTDAFYKQHLLFLFSGLIASHCS